MAGPEYLHEYVSAAVQMGPIVTGTPWALDIILANRGETTEHFRVMFLRGGASFQSIEEADIAVEPLRTGAFGLAAETDPGITAWELWWVSIATTSLNLVPTMRFFVDVDPGVPTPVPEFFFGPGDFAVFPMRLTIGAPPTNVVTEG